MFSDRTPPVAKPAKKCTDLTTQNQLSAAAKAKYLQNPGHCPVCAADQIDGSSIEVDGKQARQAVTCTACGSRWQDIYTLTDVEVCQ